MSGTRLVQGSHGPDLRPEPDDPSSNPPSSSPTVPAPVNANDSDDPQLTRSASPSSAEPAPTNTPQLGGGRRAQRPSTAAQVRDPDRYQIINEHGRGGLGRVSRAHDLDLGRDVAIKELISRGNLSEVRFLREALITARLEHPGIVPVHEAGCWPDGTPFYAMKLVAGRPLRDLIAERTTVTERIGLLHHVIAVADAIAYAHGRNIIHRDLKPANVIVGDFGETIVIDWGLAKDLSATEDSSIGDGPFRTNCDDGLTSTGSVLGTPAYMAPEQERGARVDQRADVFAIGAMLWELCALQKVPPTEPILRHRILRRAGIDGDLITILDKALDPDPAHRYPDAGALAIDLKAFKSGIRIAARSYSLFAMLAHWTRRHRAVAFSAAATIALAVIGTVLYVQNVAAARDRAQQERDRAQLAEVSLLLDKDPTSARDLLTSLTQRSPQYALLLSRANHFAAARAVRLPANITDIFIDPSTSTLTAVTSSGIFASVNVGTGRIDILDHDLRGPAASVGNHWLYARRPPKTARVTVVETSTPVRTLDAGPLLADVTGQLLAAASHIYARDNTDLYALEQGGPVLIRHGVRRIAGDDHIFMMCTIENELIVTRDGVEDQRTSCANNRSTTSMVAAGSAYAALLDTDTILLFRNNASLKLTTHITGEYALALSTSGLFALADLNGKSWVVRPNSNSIELGPAHTSRPTAVAASDKYAAWGYADGAVIAIDTKTNETWEFKGHSTFVNNIAIDAVHARVVSTAGSELRVWSLIPSQFIKISGVPCKIFNIVPSLDQTQAAMDGADGKLRIWKFAPGTVEEMHHHNNTAFGVAWLGNAACSGGFDGRVLCTSPEGGLREIMSVADSVRWIVSSPDQQKLVIATADGKIWDFDGVLHELYSHDARPYRMSFSADGQLLASGAADGTVFVYDYSRHRVAETVDMHSGLVTNVVWKDHELWAASGDGVLTRWHYDNKRLRTLNNWREPGPFRLFHLFSSGWVANVDDHFLLIALGNQQPMFKFDLSRHLEHIDVSPDERYVVASTVDEIIIIDLRHNSVTSLSISSDGAGYVGFVRPNTLAISTDDGLLTVAIDKLGYIEFGSD